MGGLLHPTISFLVEEFFHTSITYKDQLQCLLGLKPKHIVVLGGPLNDQFVYLGQE